MAFKDDYPEFASIEDLIRNARAERSAALGSMIGSALAGVATMLRRITQEPAGAQAERERNAIDADPFLRRSIGSSPRY